MSRVRRILTRLRAELRAMVGAALAWPRLLVRLAAVRVVTWRQRRTLERTAPAVARTVAQLDRTPVHDPLVARYCLQRPDGTRAGVEGMPGSVALFRSHAKAWGRRRPGEMVVRVLVPASQLVPSRPRGSLLSAIALMLVLGCGGDLVAPDGAGPAERIPARPAHAEAPPPPSPECRLTTVDSLVIDGTVYQEHLWKCERPATPKGAY